MRRMLAVLTVAVAATTAAPSGASTVTSLRCDAQTTHAAFDAYARAVYERRRIGRPALRRLDRLRACAPTKRASRRMLARQHALSERRARRLDPWGYAYARLPAATKGWLLRLRMCESTNRRYAVNGRYTGYYQYDASTWALAGGTGQAMNASPAEQHVRTARFFPWNRSRWACAYVV